MSTPIPVIPPPRPYRRFLTSVLHARFVQAALISLLIALNNSFWIGSNKDLLWSWFPLGPAGIKALLFFMSSLYVFILQIATLDVGTQTSPSHFAKVRRNLFSPYALQTFFWYLVSASWFTEAYIWSAPDLSWVTRGNHTTSDRLNERPIFFRAYSLMLAITAAASHLYLGRSSLRIPVSKLQAVSATEGVDQRTHPLESRQSQIRDELWPAVVRSAIGAGGCIVISPFVYTLFLRNILWKLHLSLAKPFFNLSRSNAYPDRYPPLGVYLLYSLFAGFLLLLTWDLSTTLFLIYLTQEPTKAGLPLSASSKDPNGTLLSGLKAKRDVVKTFAFWELAIIAQKHKDRRKAIFEDIERSTGPVWSQILEPALNVLRSVDFRINGPPPKKPVPESDIQIKTLPSIVPRVPNRSILAPSPKPTMGQMIMSEAFGEMGNSKNTWRPPVEQKAKEIETKLLEYVKPPGAEHTTSKGLLEQWMAVVQKTPAAWFFASTKSAKINAVILGSPTGNAALIVDVIESITKMLVASLSEDTYGKATPTVPETVKTFTKTLTSIESFVEANKKGADDEIEEVEIIIERLRAGLRELLAAFQLYLLDVGLGIAELNQAKKAVADPQAEEEEDHWTQQGTAVANGNHKHGSFDKQRPQEYQAPEREAPRRTASQGRRQFSGNGTSRLFPRREMEQVR